MAVAKFPSPTTGVIVVGNNDNDYDDWKTNHDESNDDEIMKKLMMILSSGKVGKQHSIGDGGFQLGHHQANLPLHELRAVQVLVFWQELLTLPCHKPCATSGLAPTRFALTFTVSHQSLPTTTMWQYNSIWFTQLVRAEPTSHLVLLPPP